MHGSSTCRPKAENVCFSVLGSSCAERLRELRLPTGHKSISDSVGCCCNDTFPKDCSRRPQIWVTQLSRCACLMYREPWQCSPRPWRHRWKSRRRRWWDGSQRGKDATVSAESTLQLFCWATSFFCPPLHINKTVVLLKGQVEEARLAGSLVLDSVNSGQDGGKFLLFLSLAVYSESD